MLRNLKGTPSFPRQTAAKTATWSAENAQIVRTSGSYDNVTLRPNRLGIVTAYSKQLLSQSSLDIQNIILSDMV
jgi:HK97 family phage major capsid protein